MSLFDTPNFSPATNGLSGLVNLKNTCYINSCLQLLSHTYELNKILFNPRFENVVQNTIEGQLLTEWKQLCELLWHRDCTVQPIKFVNTALKISAEKNIPFHPAYQHDMTEFLFFLIDSFHTGLSRRANYILEKKPNHSCFDDFQSVLKGIYAKEYSEINELFFGGIVSNIVDAESKKIITTNFEQYFQLSLPIPSVSSVTLYDCLHYYLEDVHLTDWTDETTNTKINVIKTTKMCALPPVLVISLKRFNSLEQKNSVPITIPQTNFNLNPYMEHCNPHQINYVYQLYGVCEHFTYKNAMDYGHYKSFIKVKNRKWFCFNDESVKESSFSEINSRNVYCLFYRLVAK